MGYDRAEDTMEETALIQLDDPALLRDRCYLGGTWAAADSGATFAVRDPATDEVLALVPRLL